MLEGWPESADLAREILLVEQEGDRITHDLSKRTNSTFVTPIDAEDIYSLAGRVDDIRTPIIVPCIASATRMRARGSAAFRIACHENARASIAARLGSVRLIDNAAI